MTTHSETPAKAGMPRWMIVAFAAKMVLVTAIVAAVVWWANS